MKKILSIALIAVLCLATVSATEFKISGSASLKAGYDFDNKDLWVLNNGQFAFAEVVTKSVLHKGSASANGEGDLFAVIKASIFAEKTTTINVTEINGAEDKWNVQFNEGGYTADFTVPNGASNSVIRAQIEEAYISNGTWQLNILGVKDGVDYAKSAIDSYNDGKNFVTTTSGAFVAAAAPEQVYGATFISNVKEGEEEKAYTASFGSQGANTSTSALQAGMIELPVIKAGDNVTVNAAASLISKENIDGKTTDTTINPSAKVAFANDDLTAEAAADAQFGLVYDSSAAFAWDVDASAKVVLAKPAVTIDAYYAKDATGVAAYDYAVENLLSARVSYAETIKVADKSVEATFSFTGRDLINNQDLEAKVEGTYDKITASVYGGYVIATEAIKAGAACEYEAEKYTASASVDYVKAAAETLKVKAGVTSEKIVDGAELACVYQSGNLLDKEFGGVAASITIKF